jgi:outer membrane immunogenic protein
MSTKAFLASSALALSLAFSIPAFAADPVIDPVSEPSPDRFGNNFCDAYVGVQAGYAFDDTRYSGFMPGMQMQFDQYLEDGKNDGVTGGLYAGCNFHAGSLLFGVEGDGNLAGVGYGDSWYATIRARAGAKLDNTLLYVTGGAAVGQVDMFSGNGMLSTMMNFMQGTVDTPTKWGWTVGGGVEHWFSDQVSLKTEYLYVDLGKVSTLSTMGFNGGIPVEASWKAHVVRTGLALHF